MANLYGPRIVTDGLVLHLDAGNRKSYPGSATSWNDLSGNGNNGTLVNGVSYSSSNYGVMSFDGSNDYSTVNDIAGITDFSITDNYTVEFWVNLNSTQNITESMIVEKWSQSGAYPYAFRYNRSTQKIRALVYNGSSFLLAEISISHSNWWNICGVFNWSNSILTLYGNGGQVVNSVTLDLTGTITNNSLLNLMRRGNNVGYAKGFLSNLKIYNKALSANEVLQNYNALKGRFGL